VGKANFTEDFKLDAVKQILERRQSVADVSQRLEVCLRVGRKRCWRFRSKSSAAGVRWAISNARVRSH
jgi:transposase-like protein